MRTFFILLCIFTFTSSCSDEFTPKPLGFFRIQLKQKEYRPSNLNCNYQFNINTNTKLEQGKGNCWYNIYYPKHNATLYLTYKSLNNNLAQIIEESHKLAYDHAIKSDGIIEKTYTNYQNKVFGLLYDIHGNSASNLQFFATDSISHFIRGSLYFNNIPNADSLQPVKEFIKDDIEVLFESLKWNS